LTERTGGEELEFLGTKLCKAVSTAKPKTPYLCNANFALTTGALPKNAVNTMLGKERTTKKLAEAQKS
jgi:hypothetical protein